MAEPRELQDFLAWQPEPLKPLLSDGLMFEGSRLVLYGRYKSLKSMLGIRFALAAAKGEQWLGFDTPAEGVSAMILQLEIPEQLLQERVKPMVAVGARTKQPLYLWTEHNLKVDEHEGWERVRVQLNRLKPTVLVIDPIYKIMSGNILDAHQVQKLLDAIDKLLADHPQMGVMLISHTRKGAYDEAFGSDDLIGSMFFSAWADSVVRVERKAFSEIEVKFEIVRHAKREIDPRTFTVGADDISFTRQMGVKFT